MISRMLFLWFVVLVTCCAAEIDAYDEETIEKGDAYIDKILKDMFDERLDEYDPYKIEDRAIGFSRKIVFVNISGEAKLHDGYIAGLRTLHRPQHCSLERENERLKIKADLGVGVLDFHYSGSIKFMNFGPTISVHGHLGYVAVHMEFTVDSKTGRHGELEKFIIDDMRGISVRITGLGPLNWAFNPIVSTVTKIFRRFLRNLLQNKVEKHIAENIRNFQFPVAGIDTTESAITEVTEEVESNPTKKLPEVAELLFETDPADNVVENAGLPKTGEFSNELSETENFLSTSDIKYADED